MGQLIKLQDYVSRYEQDIYAYPTRFVRLKKDQWEGMKDHWSQGPVSKVSDEDNNINRRSEKVPLFEKLKELISFKTKGREDSKTEDIPPSASSLDPIIPASIDSIEKLKKYFLDQLLPFQLKWASSTLTEKSFLDRSYLNDERLKFLLQRLPDTFLILYKPIFLLKNASVETDVILITPTGIWSLAFLETEQDTVFIGSKERFWVKRTGEIEGKLLNPLIGLNRTDQIVRKLFQVAEIDLPVHKALITMDGYIDFPSRPYDTNFVEKRDFDEWFKSLRSLKSPLKHMQLKAALALLQHCRTQSVRRPEWEIHNESERWSQVEDK
ncbi:nuclease-related domain-containing protein [Mesobacillus harenae]|uniref:nuclease-related domain-containing protein n=1 Tax=Mesobacillus harenae TaxID=2213203 RepID=UPI00158057FD|nr:nuclease-related domain-containing protein [Mesobacillus harenae]